MARIPAEHRDATLSFLREGYLFIPNRCRRYGSDIFETRALGNPLVCISGADAARAFYEPGRMTRRQALPPTVLTLLQDKGSAATLDGSPHRHRKEMFLAHTSPGRFDELRRLVEIEWRSAAERWQRRSAVRLHSAAQEILCRAVCGWAGVPLAEHEVVHRTREFAAMIDGAGSVGARQLRAQLLRQRNELWMRRIVRGIRSGKIEVPTESPAWTLATRPDYDGQPLDVKVAAVELINLLRPTVAVARFITFAALGLHQHSAALEHLRDGGPDAVEHVVQEVRRYYPFFPAIGGRVLEPFEWRGRQFGRGELVMLDVYGTNRDSRSWESPASFRPERFRDWQGDPFTLIPQGGGDHAENHRCAGEWISIALIGDSIRFLTSDLRYRVPPQDLSIDLGRVPALPASGFVISDVEFAADASGNGHRRGEPVQEPLPTGASAT